ncbi:MAG: nucleotide sugar dehydrogenase [Verrucomicrobiales bacterium]
MPRGARASGHRRGFASAKVAAFSAGRSPIVEPDLDRLLSAAVGNGLLEGSSDPARAIAASEVSIVCVGTPSLESGQLNLDYVRNVTGQISAAIRSGGGRPHALIFRSTMLPGSTRAICDEFLAEPIGAGDLRVFYCPEFLREGSAIADFRDPSLSLFGSRDGVAEGVELLRSLFGVTADAMAWEAAEMVKYACNYFHALKVGFANEIGRMAKRSGIDGARIMEVLCQDERLNISPYYLRPGNPFGGSCLPKDVSALSAFARQKGVGVPILESVLTSNQAHLDALLRLITSGPERDVCLLGLTFKSGTDDLRGSPMVAVAENLIGSGYRVRIYDPDLNLPLLIGSNEQSIRRRMPHLADLLKDDPAEAIGGAELVVAAQRCLPLHDLKSMLVPTQRLIDVNGWRELEDTPARYEGFCW